MAVACLIPCAASTNWGVESGDADGRRPDNEGVFITESDFAVCVDEASHIVLANRLGLQVKWVDLTWQDGGLNGYTFIVEGPKLASYLTVLLAGEVGQTEIFGRQILGRTYAGSDRETLYRFVVRHGSAGEQALVVARQTCPRLVRAHAGAIRQLANDLLVRVAQAQGDDVTVEGEELARLLGGDDVAILKLAPGDDQTRLLAATDVATLKRAMNG